MYQVVYDFFSTYVWAGAPSSSWSIGGVSVTMTEWLSHTSAIITLAVLCFVCFKFIGWLVRLFANIGR